MPASHKHYDPDCIHTEMFSDGIIDMVESGVITGKHKSIDNGKVVASFCMGTQRLYDYVDNNLTFSFHPTEYVNDPFLISRQHKMVTINVALEVDLTGQARADSLGTRFFSARPVLLKSRCSTAWRSRSGGREMPL